MKAMILAAGAGTRLLPLTEAIPKALIEVGTRSLIEHQIVRLAAAGIVDIVINHAYLGAQIEARLGDGSAYGVAIRYSAEGDNALETGGGIMHALPILGVAPFVLVNADVWSDYSFERLPSEPDGLAHLVMVPDPVHNPDGDFALVDGFIHINAEPRLTYAGIGVYRPEMFDEGRDGRLPLAPFIRHAASQGLVTGECYEGYWMDVGTPERLSMVRAHELAHSD